MGLGWDYERFQVLSPSVNKKKRLKDVEIQLNTINFLFLISYYGPNQMILLVHSIDVFQHLLSRK